MKGTNISFSGMPGCLSPKINGKAAQASLSSADDLACLGTHLIPELSMTSNGRPPSPHLRGNPLVASQMRSELHYDAYTTTRNLASAASPQQHISPASVRSISPHKKASMDQVLESLGFKDKSVNEALMQKHAYQLDKVLDDLIAGIGSQTQPDKGSQTLQSPVVKNDENERRRTREASPSHRPVSFGESHRAPLSPTRSVHVDKGASRAFRDKSESFGGGNINLASWLGMTCIEGLSTYNFFFASSALLFCKRFFLSLYPRSN